MFVHNQIIIIYLYIYSVFRIYLQKRCDWGVTAAVFFSLSANWPDFVVGKCVFLLDDPFELVDDDGGELGKRPAFELRAGLEVDQWVVEEGERPMREGRAGELEPQAANHASHFDKQVGRFAEHQLHVDGQVKAAVVLDVHLEVELLGHAVVIGSHWLHEPGAFEERKWVSQVDVAEAESLQQAARRLGEQQLLELHLDLLGEPVPDYWCVSQLPEQEKEYGVQKVARLRFLGLTGLRWWMLFWASSASRSVLLPGRGRRSRLLRLLLPTRFGLLAAEVVIPQRVIGYHFNVVHRLADGVGVSPVD